MASRPKRLPIPLTTVTNLIRQLSSEKHKSAVAIRNVLQLYCEDPRAQATNDSFWQMLTDTIRNNLGTLQILCEQENDTELKEALGSLLPHVRINWPYHPVQRVA